MVWYESARLVHGRTKPLNGSYFENLFVHYMPRSQLWYGEDWDLDYGVPVKNITLEMMKEADMEMEVKRKELKRKIGEDEMIEKQKWESLSWEERLKSHAEWVS